MLVRAADRRTPVFLVAIVVTLASAVLIMAGALAASPIGRRLAVRFLSSLRLHRAQLVDLDLSRFVGPDASPTLQQMIAEMISDKITVIDSEADRPATTRAQASRLAGFPVQLPAQRKDVPSLTVNGRYAFRVSVDRARLQAILNEADRSDLVLSPSIEGATVSVTVPRSATARYGTCPGRRSALAGVAGRSLPSARYAGCLLLTEGPSPEIRMPPALSLEPFMEIGLEVAGLTSPQAQRFLSNVRWKTILAAPLPRMMRSYKAVAFGGVQGTLFGMGGLRGPAYALVWSRDGVVYSLIGFGDVASAVALAESLS